MTEEKKKKGIPFSPALAGYFAVGIFSMMLFKSIFGKSGVFAKFGDWLDKEAEARGYANAKAVYDKAIQYAIARSAYAKSIGFDIRTGFPPGFPERDAWYAGAGPTGFTKANFAY